MPDVDPLTRVARNLREIVDLAAALRDQAVHKANDRLMPGGLAMVALSPVASCEAWENRQQTTERTGQAYTVAEDEGDWTPPLQDLLFWSEAWRRELEQDWNVTPTLVSEASWLAHQVGWAWDHEPHFEDFAEDVHDARATLEAMLYAGARSMHGVNCFGCNAELVRASDEPRHCACGPRPNAHVSEHFLRNDACCLGCAALAEWEGRHANCQQGGLRDEWRCPNCERKYDPESYALAVRHAHFAHAEWLPIEQCAERTSTPGRTITAWATRGHVRTKPDPTSGRQTYSVSDVETRRAANEAVAS